MSIDRPSLNDAPDSGDGAADAETYVSGSLSASPSVVPDGPRGNARLRWGAYVFEVVNERRDLEVELLRGVDALIINVDAVGACEEIVRSIRAHTDRAVYLKPIFLLDGNEAAGPLLESLIDGYVYSLERLEKAAGVIKSVLKKDEQFALHHSVSFEDNVITKVLRFLVSRGRRTVEPVPSRFAKLGVSYPIVDVNYQYESEHKALNVLDAAEEDNLLVGEFVDAWYVCRTCSESRIHLREVCSGCGTSDLKEEELIHHFRCAYVGPVSDFSGDDAVGALSCPKCGHHLNHVGVDYDKPSTIFTCHNGHTSQNPSLVARCFTCGSETQAEKLAKRSIKSYVLTPKGEEKALSGVLANVRTLSEIDGVIDFATFETMLQFEIERIRVTNETSSLAVVHFGNAGELFSFLGRDERTGLLTSLVDLARTHLRATDALSFKNFSTLFCLIPVSSPDHVREDLQRAVDAFRSQISSSYEGYLAHVAAQAGVIPREETADDLMKRLLSTTVESLISEYD